MKGKISIITLAVADLDRSVAFYRDGLGLPTYDYEKSKNIAFFNLEGTWLSLYPKERFGKDTGIPVGESGSSHFTLAHNVKTKQEVDEVIDLALKAGAKLIKKPKEVFWGGYSGYFADPDGYLWEVAFNPFMDLT